MPEVMNSDLVLLAFLWAGSAEPVSMGAPLGPPQPRPLTGGGQPPPAKADNEPRPIIGTSGTGGGFDLTKLLEQQRLHQQQQVQQAVRLPPHLSTPMARPLGAGPAPPPPFMPIAPGPIPMQANTQASMQNAMLMQQINRGEGTGLRKVECHRCFSDVWRLVLRGRFELRAVVPSGDLQDPLSRFT